MGEGAATPAAAFTTLERPCAPPTLNLSAAPPTPGAAESDLTIVWSASTPGAAAGGITLTIDYYTVTVSATDGGPTVVRTITVPAVYDAGLQQAIYTLVVAGLPVGRDYLVEVAATDTGGVTPTSGTPAVATLRLNQVATVQVPSATSDLVTGPIVRPSQVMPAPMGSTPSQVTPSVAQRVAATPGSGMVVINSVPTEATIEPGTTNNLSRFAARMPQGSPHAVLVNIRSTTPRVDGLLNTADGRGVSVDAQRVVIVEAAEVAVMLVAASAAGEPAPLVDGVLTMTAGGQVAALAYGLPPGATGEIVVLSTPRLLASITTASDGSFAGQVPLPTDLEPGSHTIVLTAGGVTASLGVNAIASATTATPPSSPPETTVASPTPDEVVSLPTTGTRTTVALAATLMILTGFMLLVRMTPGWGHRVRSPYRHLDRSR